MRSAVEYIKSWFGRFEVVTRRRPDPWLWLPAAALLMLGLLMVLNTTYFLSIGKTGSPFYYFRRQLINIAVGLGGLLLLSQFSLKGFKRIAWPLIVTAFVMLILLWIPGLGLVRGGARRWLRIGTLVLEPSEIAKFAAVFFLAYGLSKRHERIAEFVDGPLPVLVVIAPMALIFLKQPDFGATVVLATLLIVMLWAAGTRATHLSVAGGFGVLLLLFEAGRKAYRARRFAAFLDPWRVARGAGFQLIQSFVALGAGGKWGVGLGAGRQKMFYLPQAHTDFVFAVVGEEFGMLGTMIVVALFGAILVRGMRIAHNEPDPFASLLAVGMTSLITLQAVFNMAVVIGLVPTKGLPLPFLSYGGTSMIISLAALGVLLALGQRPAVR